MGSTIIRSASTVVGVLALGVAGCAGRYVSPLAPPPYRAEIESAYDDTWRAIVNALAAQNVPPRAVARDSGVIASEDIVSPIGVYVDCERIGDDRLQGEAVVSYTLFATANGSITRVQMNPKARTQAHRKDDSGTLHPTPVYPCVSTGRFELNLIDAVRELVRR